MNNQIAKDNRLQMLDFIRGLAIILVLFRHSSLHNFILTKIGWIGVDLFFVLSGFLVSGLLFKEYNTYGEINIKRFLIRRGFKIYPLFYITAIPYILFQIYYNNFSLYYLFGDLLFMQNYVSNWAYLYPGGWSLAVEEHFYLLIAFTFYLIHKKIWFQNAISSKDKWADKLLISFILIQILVLVLRFLSNYYFLPDNHIKNYTMSHLRIDSILSGTILSYCYYNKFDKLKSLYLKYKKIILFTSIVCFSWVLFISNQLISIFSKTIGFSFLYISFSFLLLSLLIDEKASSLIKSIFTKKGINFISKIGYNSYSIYLIHTLINDIVFKIQNAYGLYYEKYLYFFICQTISITLGIFMTNYIEKYFIQLRNKIFPSRIV